MVCPVSDCAGRCLGTERPARPTVLHRDLKARNILLGYGLRVKLADFGLAKVKMRINDPWWPPTGQAGTILWMARELFADEPSMIHCLGYLQFGHGVVGISHANAPLRQISAQDRWHTDCDG